jgi:hypothetical protein
MAGGATGEGVCGQRCRVSPRHNGSQQGTGTPSRRGQRHRLVVWVLTVGGGGQQPPGYEIRDVPAGRGQRVIHLWCGSCRLHTTPPSGRPIALGGIFVACCGLLGRGCWRRVVGADLRLHRGLGAGTTAGGGIVTEETTLGRFLRFLLPSFLRSSAPIVTLHREHHFGLSLTAGN